jgi:hypothetical protein
MIISYLQMNSQGIFSGDKFAGNSFWRWIRKEFLLEMNSQGILTADEFVGNSYWRWIHRELLLGMNSLYSMHDNDKAVSNN